MISYGEILWGNLMGMSYGAFLSFFNDLSFAWLGWAGLAGPGRAGPASAGLGWPGLGWHEMSLAKYS